MLKISTINRQRFAEFLSYILCIFLIILISGCEGDSVYTNQTPTATITSPLALTAGEALIYNEGDIITFTGSGTDEEDKNLSGDSLIWSSSIDGPIGTGSYFTKNDLAAGIHTVTLTALDSDGAAGSDSTQITINP